MLKAMLSKCIFMDDYEKKARFERKVFVVIIVFLVVFFAIYYMFAQYIVKAVGKGLGESLAGPAQDLCDYVDLGRAIVNFFGKFSTH